MSPIHLSSLTAIHMSPSLAGGVQLSGCRLPVASKASQLLPSLLHLFPTLACGVFVFSAAPLLPSDRPPDLPPSHSYQSHHLHTHSLTHITYTLTHSHTSLTHITHTLTHSHTSLTHITYTLTHTHHLHTHHPPSHSLTHITHTHITYTLTHTHHLHTHHSHTSLTHSSLTHITYTLTHYLHSLTHTHSHTSLTHSLTHTLTHSHTSLTHITYTLTQE